MIGDAMVVGEHYGNYTNRPQVDSDGDSDPDVPSSDEDAIANDI